MVTHPTPHRVIGAFALALLLVAGGACPFVAHGALDLVPDVFDVSVQIADVGPDEVTEGCAGGTSARRLVRFALRIRNLGPDDLLVGEPRPRLIPTTDACSARRWRSCLLRRYGGTRHLPSGGPRPTTAI